MTQRTKISRRHELWAQFRFSVIGWLLIAPIKRGQLSKQIGELAKQRWRHPISGKWTYFGASTIERWYYAARRERTDPVKVLRRKIRDDHGTCHVFSVELQAQLKQQYRDHPSWSYKLHCDNLVVLVKEKPALGPVPSYSSVRRFMNKHGMRRRARRGPVHSPGAALAEERFVSREVRSYESEYVNALWHLDFHCGKLRVLLPNGQWGYPVLFGVLDDRSRLCGHAQWYLTENSENLCHGLSQALQKHQLPRSLMSDNGSAMIAAETTRGLQRLGIVHETILPYSPYQNGKQENFWAQVEGRLIPMLEGVEEVTLRLLNEATQAWVDGEYNRKVHSEIKKTPLDVYMHHPGDVGRPCPKTEQLRLAFTTEEIRTQRRSDGTISLNSVRYEIPARYAHLPRICLRYAAWDLGRVHITDATTGNVLCRIFPQDKHKNADARRALRGSPDQQPDASAEKKSFPGMAPLLKELIASYASTGLPSAYVPKDDISKKENTHE